MEALHDSRADLACQNSSSGLFKRGGQPRRQRSVETAYAQVTDGFSSVKYGSHLGVMGMDHDNIGQNLAERPAGHDPSGICRVFRERYDRHDTSYSMYFILSWSA